MERPDRTIGLDDPVKVLDWFQNLLLQERQKALAIIRVDSVDHPLAIQVARCGTVAPQFLVRRASVKQLFGVDIGHPTDLIDVLDNLPE
jgi:hypothetical protein